MLFRLFHNQTGAGDKQDDWLTEGYWGRETHTLRRKEQHGPRSPGLCPEPMVTRGASTGEAWPLSGRLRGRSGLSLCG